MERILLLEDINKENSNQTLENKLGKNPPKKISDTQMKEIEKQILFYEKNPNLEDIIETENDFQDNNNSNESAQNIYIKNNKFKYISPLNFRKTTNSRNKEPAQKNKTRQVAIKEVITNLKTQYILFNIKNFITNYQIYENPKINMILYKISLLLRNIILCIYGLIMLFERPWFCCNGTTISLSSRFNFIEDCEKDVVFSDMPFINDDAIRTLELLFTLTLIITQIIKFKVECSLRETLTEINRTYIILQIFLIISLGLCVIDLIISLIKEKFPIINFLCRPIIFIFLIRRLKVNWTNILIILWKTRKAYLVLIYNLVTFSIIGYVFFYKEGGYFSSLGHSVLELYILLSTCNFPDIMLEAMETSKFAIIYFFICISMNYFILLSYLNNLYNTKYYNINKEDCLKIIRDIIDNKKNKYIYGVQKFTRFLMKEKFLYNLNEDEYSNILILFNLYNKKNDLYYRFLRRSELTPEAEMITNNKYGHLILKSFKFEIILNLIYIFWTLTIMILDFKYIIFLIIHLLFSLIIIYEPIILIQNIGFAQFFKNHFYRFLFHIFNLIVIILIIFAFIFFPYNDHSVFDDENSRYYKLSRILKIFISLRTIRIMVFLNKFQIIKNIYIIIRISKEMVIRNMLTLYSFIFMYSTLSMLLIGGNIKKNAFHELGEIPDDYQYINFNDFGSSYISCFCLLMINNLNILVKSLTFHTEKTLFYKFYFASFFFIATLIMINIIETILLEMYLISDNSLSDKEFKKEIKIIRNKKNEIDLNVDPIFRVNSNGNSETL